MPKPKDSPPPVRDPDEVDLKDPVVAALLAWLVPGLGHWYQGRRSKALLFFVCILGTFAYGLLLGSGRVVYASMRPGDRRLPYLCQIGVGLSAVPALVQAYRFRDPHLREQADERWQQGRQRWTDWFMAPPSLQRRAGADELDEIHKRLARYFELGTVYTMVAGLLNILAIYDAGGGPALGSSGPQDTPARKEDEQPAEEKAGAGADKPD